MSLNSRNKGKRGELEFRDECRKAGYTAERGQQRKGGSDSPDVIIKELPWLHPEVKRAERFRLYPSMAQAEGDADSDQMPVVFHRRSRHRWVAVIRIDDFWKFVTSYEYDMEVKEQFYYHK